MFFNMTCFVNLCGFLTHYVFLFCSVIAVTCALAMLLFMMFLLLTVYTFKLICIFIFVIYCVYAVLMIASRDSVDDKLEVLTEQLTEKERALQQSQDEIKNAEDVLNDLESKTSSCRDRYRFLINEIKTDIRKTKDEVRILQNQISRLSIKREALRNEQQEGYQQMLNTLSRKLENKKALYCLEKSRHHRVSCFPLS